MSTVKERLKEIFEITLESDIRYEGVNKSLDYYNLFCKAASKENLYKICGNNLCMFNYSYNGEDSVLMLFSLPINGESGAKSIAERVMEIIGYIEECFITTDYIKSEEVKEDKFVYITVIKKIGEK